LTKEVTDWVIEGPRKFDKDCYQQNNYTRELDTVHIATEEGILKVESKTVKKLVCLRSHWVKQEENFKQGNL
jgi:NADH-quinone oxidoreductase subunit G